ncbi:hypothetical protein CDL15_Pgr003897 [Punica granatum]|nr:hypothetical protein CDL15_Pgr003897 [Punica granatum]
MAEEDRVDISEEVNPSVPVHSQPPLTHAPPPPTPAGILPAYSGSPSTHLWPPTLCAPEFNLLGARMREAYATRLGSVHLPGDARRTHLRRSRHLPFYNPKVEDRQVTRV